MKLSIPIAVGVVLAGLTAPAAVPAQVRVVVGDPGPGWTRWHDRRYDRRWTGPRWHNGRGRHYGWYNWRGSYYQNCAWRWDRRHRREWRCW